MSTIINPTSSTIFADDPRRFQPGGNHREELLGEDNSSQANRANIGSEELGSDNSA